MSTVRTPACRKHLKHSSHICAESFSGLDNASNDADIANLFGKKYDELYNSVSYNKSDMENLSECVKASINVNDKYTISVHVTNAVLHMKKDKTDGHEGLCSDNIINAPHSLFIILTLIYNTMLVYGLDFRYNGTHP